MGSETKPTEQERAQAKKDWKAMNRCATDVGAESILAQAIADARERCAQQVLRMNLNGDTLRLIAAAIRRGEP